MQIKIYSYPNGVETVETREVPDMPRITDPRLEAAAAVQAAAAEVDEIPEDELIPQDKLLVALAKLILLDHPKAALFGPPPNEEPLEGP